jgi:hypothetical protein
MGTPASARRSTAAETDPREILAQLEKHYDATDEGCKATSQHWRDIQALKVNLNE